MGSRSDWQEVVDRQPGGYVELNNGVTAIHGPIESIEIVDDVVIIWTRWQATAELNEVGLAQSPWKCVPENEPISFPNRTVGFEFEDTPEKGPRIRFGLSVLYFDSVDGIDPAKVEGLVLSKLERIRMVVEETTKAKQREATSRKHLTDTIHDNNLLCAKIHESMQREDGLSSAAYSRIRAIILEK